MIIFTNLNFIIQIKLKLGIFETNKLILSSFHLNYIKN